MVKYIKCTKVSATYFARENCYPYRNKCIIFLLLVCIICKNRSSAGLQWSPIRSRTFVQRLFTSNKIQATFDGWKLKTGILQWKRILRLIIHTVFCEGFCLKTKYHFLPNRNIYIALFPWNLFKNLSWRNVNN